MIRTDFTALFCILIPLPLILGAPVDDVLKQQQQQISSGGFREEPYWNYYNQGRGLTNKKLDSLAGDVFGLAKKFDSISGATFGTQKRNFDEIDRNGFGAFVKRNFDEIDRNGFGFYKRNFDEIDRTGFGAFVKRAA